MLMWISRTIEPLFCLTTYGIASNYKLKTKHHVINFCEDFDKKRPYLILSYLTAVTYMSLIVQMCVCVCVFSWLFLCPLFYASNPILSLYNTPKVSKIKHPFSVFTVLFCQFSSPDKATNVHVFPLSQHIS